MEAARLDTGRLSLYMHSIAGIDRCVVQGYRKRTYFAEDACPEDARTLSEGAHLPKMHPYVHILQGIYTVRRASSSLSFVYFA